MVGDIRIDAVNINIGNVFVSPEAQPDILKSVIEQALAGASPESLREMGYTAVPDEVAPPDDAPTPEEQAEIEQAEAEELTQEMIDLDTRSDNLHMLVSKVDKMSSKRGFGTNDERQPRDSKKINEMRSEYKRAARNSLKRACAACVFQHDCSMAGNLDAWLDAHPYKDKSGRRRPGSLRVDPPEARTKFIERLRANPKIHCDPAERKK